MKTLADVLITGVEVLDSLASKAPKDDEKSTASGAGRGKKTRPGASSKADLGPMDVGAYLSHYNINYSIKSSGTKQIYRLDRCLFDESHTKNEASVIQDESGLITYQCFHNSCKGSTWPAARRLISGGKKHPEFCAGYDPSKRRPRKVSPFEKQKNGNKAADPEPEAETAAPPPIEVTPDMFFDESGKSSVFVPQWLAKHLQNVYDPLVFDGMEFFSYQKSGVWKALDYDLIGQESERALDKFAKSARIQDTIKILGHRAFVTPAKFRHNTDYLNLENGMITLPDLALKKHDPKYYSRIQMPVTLEKTADCPRWLQFLEEIFPDEPEKAMALQSYMGYCLLPDCRFQKCLFLIGAGANGKSVVVDVLISILGEENVCSLPLQLMGQRFLIGQLKDKLVNVATEISTNQPMDTANFKDAVAGGLLMADQKHGKPFAFYPVAKHLFSMNEVPKITDKSYGFQRRPIVLSFTQRFEGAACDPHLTRKLVAERNGIFFWMLEGLATILETDDLYVPEVVNRDTEAFVKSTNPARLFVDDQCFLGNEFMVKPPDLYRAYLAWCDEGHNRPLARNRFYDQIMIHYPSVKSVKSYRDGKQDRVYQGLGLKERE